MCGITGIYNYKSEWEVSEPELRAMKETLVHRGPDSDGIFISPDRKAGFGFQRLAIIDLSRDADQPMLNDDGSVAIILNGEIYNFKELRGELERKYKFKSQSDTEVILRGYEEWGEDVVRRLNGMFAFAIYDSRSRSIFAARDHIGVKPFYYALQNGAFYFGSEIKAILANSNFKKNMAEENIIHYLTFASLPSPKTLFKDIQKLPPAHSIKMSLGKEPEIKEYWHPFEKNISIPRDNKEEFFISETRRLLKDSVESQMVSDVPFGCFLSGGVDSSINATLMSRAMGTPVETFSIGSSEHETYNEFQYSRAIAKKLGAKTHEMTVTENDLLEFFPHYAKHADDPNGDQINFLVFYLSKLIRKSGVVVAQVGEGADELYAGYPAYRLSAGLYKKLWKHLARLPRSARLAMQGLSGLAMPASKEFEAEYFRRLANGEEPFWGNAIAFSPTQTQRLLTDSFRKKTQNASPYELIKEQYDVVDKLRPDADFLTRMTYLELKIRLPELLLARVDKMSMANSIEARVPFLDRRLVELAINIPEDLKLKGGHTKYILKKAAEGIIPHDIIWRKKQGFGAPMTEWLRDPDVSKALLAPLYNSKLMDSGIFNKKYIDDLIGLHKKGKVNHNFRIWNLISLSLWHDHWIE